MQINEIILFSQLAGVIIDRIIYTYIFSWRQFTHNTAHWLNSKCFACYIQIKTESTGNWFWIDALLSRSLSLSHILRFFLLFYFLRWVAMNSVRSCPVLKWKSFMVKNVLRLTRLLFDGDSGVKTIWFIFYTE